MFGGILVGNSLFYSVFHLLDIIIVTCSTNSDKQFIYLTKFPKMNTIYIDCEFVIWTIVPMGMRHLCIGKLTVGSFVHVLLPQFTNWMTKFAAFAVNSVVVSGKHQIYYMFDIWTKIFRQYVDLCSCGIFKYLHMLKHICT